MSLNINGSGGSGININGTATSSATTGGGASTVVIDTYPPTNTSTTAVASVNCVRQVYNAIGSGGVSVLDAYPPTSSSSTAVPSARVMLNTFNLANSALSSASSATTTATSALTATQVSASTTQAGMVQLIDSTTSTSLTLAPTANALKTVATLASMTASTTQAGMVQLIDSTTSTSLTLAPTANALKTVATIANSAITSTTLTTSTNFGGSATGGVVVGLSGQTLTLQSIVNPIAIQVAFSDEATAITTANMTNIRAPYSFNIRTLPLFMLYSLGTAGTTTFDIMKNGQTIYGTKPSISYVASPANSQYTSSANSGTLLLNPTPFSQFDLIKVYVFSAGTGHLGAKCVITIS